MRQTNIIDSFFQRASQTLHMCYVNWYLSEWTTYKYYCMGQVGGPIKYIRLSTGPDSGPATNISLTGILV